MPESTNTTRQALLDAAEALFSSRGFAAVGIREIADRAGANLASIKYHFGSKYDLYLATVRRVMEAHDLEGVLGVLAEIPADRQAAATLLVRLVYAFVAKIAARPHLDACGALIMREALQPSEAIDDVVRDYMKPSEDDMIKLLGRLVPDASEDVLRRYSDTVFGQLMHYSFFRPFVERLGSIDMSNKADAEQIAHHAAVFTLRGLGCDEAMIQRALTDAKNRSDSPSKEGND